MIKFNNLNNLNEYLKKSEAENIYMKKINSFDLNFTSLLTSITSKFSYYDDKINTLELVVNSINLNTLSMMSSITQLTNNTLYLNNEFYSIKTNTDAHSSSITSIMVNTDSMWNIISSMTNTDTNIYNYTRELGRHENETWFDPIQELTIVENEQITFKNNFNNSRTSETTQMSHVLGTNIINNNLNLQAQTLDRLGVKMLSSYADMTLCAHTIDLCLMEFMNLENQILIGDCLNIYTSRKDTAARTYGNLQNIGLNCGVSSVVFGRYGHHTGVEWDINRQLSVISNINYANISLNNYKDYPNFLTIDGINNKFYMNGSKYSGIDNICPLNNNTIYNYTDGAMQINSFTGNLIVSNLGNNLSCNDNTFSYVSFQDIGNLDFMDNSVNKYISIINSDNQTTHSLYFTGNDFNMTNNCSCLLTNWNSYDILENTFNTVRISDTKTSFDCNIFNNSGNSLFINLSNFSNTIFIDENTFNSIYISSFNGGNYNFGNCSHIPHVVIRGTEGNINNLKQQTTAPISIYYTGKNCTFYKCDVELLRFSTDMPYIDNFTCNTMTGFVDILTSDMKPLKNCSIKLLEKEGTYWNDIIGNLLLQNSGFYNGKIEMIGTRDFWKRIIGAFNLNFDYTFKDVLVNNIPTTSIGLNIYSNRSYNAEMIHDQPSVKSINLYSLHPTNIIFSNNNVKLFNNVWTDAANSDRFTINVPKTCSNNWAGILSKINPFGDNNHYRIDVYTHD